MLTPKIILLFIAVLNSNLFYVHSQRRVAPPGRFNVGYGVFDPLRASHGGRRNEEFGGTCAEFLEINQLNQCCANREDDCYMIHYDTRCYCDIFCHRREPDCCPDARSICDGGPIYTPPPPPPPTLPPPTTTPYYEPEPPILEPVDPQPEQIIGGPCEKDGVAYSEGAEVEDNCNTCTCSDSKWFCSSRRCLVDTKVLTALNRGGSSWKAANYSKFWGKTLDYGYRHRLGTKLPDQNQKPIDPLNYFKISELNEALPTSYDFREDPEVRDAVRRSPIRDQGDCAASWAFSTVDVATDRLIKVTKGRHGNQTNYSVQQLLSCAILKNDQDGCSGSTIDIAWNQINHVKSELGGLVEERCLPYTNHASDRADDCKVRSSKNVEEIRCPSDPEGQYDGSILLASPAYPLKVTTEDDIKREIIKQGPVQAIFRVYSDFFMYKEGVYQRSRSAQEYDHKDPYHSVKILGWGTENGVNYWLCANSWGTDWGENGYFKIARGEAEIDMHIFAAWGNGKINGKLLFTQKNLNNRVMNMYMNNL